MWQFSVLAAVSSNWSCGSCRSCCYLVCCPFDTSGHWLLPHDIRNIFFDSFSIFDRLSSEVIFSDICTYFDYSKFPQPCTLSILPHWSMRICYVEFAVVVVSRLGPAPYPTSVILPLHHHLHHFSYHRYDLFNVLLWNLDRRNLRSREDK